MAVFSNNPRIQGQWQQVQQLNLLASVPCSPTQERVTDLCRYDDDKRRRLGAACIVRETITVKCEDYAGAAARAQAELDKLIAADGKAKADAENKAADIAAERAIIERRRANDAALTDAIKAACVYETMNVDRKIVEAKQAACARANENFTKNKSPSGYVTFDEVARERGQSAATGARAAPGVVRALARPRRTPRVRLPRPKPAPRVPKRPVLRAKRVSSASSG